MQRHKGMKMLRCCGLARCCDILLLIVVLTTINGEAQALHDASIPCFKTCWSSSRVPVLMTCRGGALDSHSELDAKDGEASKLDLDKDSSPSSASSLPPEGFYLEHDMVSEETWKKLEEWLEHDTSIPWEIGAQDRRVAQFGFRYNYDTSVVEFADAVPEIPELMKQLLLETMATKRVLANIPADDPATVNFTQCIINVYNANDIIPFHWDHVDFGPTVLVFTFGEARPLKMRQLLRELPAGSLPRSQCHHEEGDYDAKTDYEYYDATPRHGSCYVLTGPARYQWEHSVPSGSGYRVSITFRTHDNNQSA